MAAPEHDRVGEANHTDWYWDLDKRIAVRADQRGPADHTLGPYETRAEAENWKTKSNHRNDIWDTADEEWNNPDPTND